MSKGNSVILRAQREQVTVDLKANIGSRSSQTKGERPASASFQTPNGANSLFTQLNASSED